MDNIILIGGSGQARVVADIVEREGRFRIAGLLDDGPPPGSEAFGYPVLGPIGDAARIVSSLSIDGGLVAVGDNALRGRLAETVRTILPGLRFVTAVHPAAVVGRGATIGEGTVIMAGAVVNPGCSVGRFCIINTASSLDHDSRMDDFSSLAPGAVTGGNVRLGAYAAVCIGAVLKHGVAIGEHSVIGAGAVVLADIGPHKTAYGVPARVVRERAPGDRYL